MAIFNSSGGGGTNFTTDNSLQMSAENMLGVTTPVQGIKTQAEFDALPADDQNKGLWVISDGGSGGESAGGDIYSTEETRIGTWIDGKPLYRISNQYDVSNAELDSGIVLQDLAALNMDLVTNMTATINTSAAAYPIPFVREIVTAGAITQLSVISLFSNRLIFRTTNENFRGTLLATIEYTKTTDTAPQEVTI